MALRAFHWATAVALATVIAAPAAFAKGGDTPTTAEVPAKQLFGKAKSAAALPARAIGFYSRGCLAGARRLAIDGPSWQAMRLSRNRNWGHPVLLSVVERLARDAQKLDGWPGLLVGDMSQPRGGPMLTGHASHQIGLDVDIWLTPMPNRRLSDKEREETSAVSMLKSKIAVDPKVFTPTHVKLIKRASSYPEVERVLVHPAIKKALCQAAGDDKKWLAKVRPYWGHHYHMHVRIGCPKGSEGCRNQKPVTGDDGCGKELDGWYRLLTRPPRPKRLIEKPAKPPKPKPEITLANLPPECRLVLEAGEAKTKEAQDR